MRVPDRERVARIGNLALPIVGGMLSQIILNQVDTAMVGTLGRHALATASYAAFMALAVVMGLSSSVQALSSRRVGAGETSEVAAPLTGGLLLAVLIGAPVMIVMSSWSSALLPYLNNDPEVIAAGLPYFDARIMGIIAVGVNFSFRE